MSGRMADGSAGDANYSVIGAGYARYRRPDPRFGAAIEAAFGDARTVVNVGAGAGSYEPTDRAVTPVEPSAAMRAQRPAHLAPAVDATTEARRYPALSRIAEGLGGTVDVSEIPIPLDCTDGFSEAYYGRPEALLDPGARWANSAWSFVDDGVAERFERTLRADLDSGGWDERHGPLRTAEAFDGSLRLIVSRPGDGGR